MPKVPKVKPSDNATSPVVPARALGDGRMQMSDIAELAGVSTATVSRALSGSKLINEATRQRVVDIARSVNYEINAGAANLRKRDVRTIGVVMLGDALQRQRQPVSDPFLLSLVGSLADALTDSNHDMLLARHSVEHMGALAALVQSGRVAGLIVIGQWPGHNEINAMAERGMPLVAWGCVYPGSHYPVVGGDNLNGGYLATQHLLNQGCQRIAFLGDTKHMESESAQRYAGYLKALTERGIAPDPALVQPLLFSDPEVRKAVTAWLALKTPMDAVFATSDMAAIRTVRVLAEKGIRVPQDVKVVGYDDIALAQHLHPSLTSIRQPTDLAGQALVKLLFDVIAGHAPASIVLPAELMVRDSSCLAVPVPILASSVTGKVTKLHGKR